MGKNAEHVQELREQLKRRILIRDGGAGLQATPNGRAAKVTSVKDVRVDDKGNLIVTKRDDFIGEGGNVAGIGGAVEQNIGKVGTKEKNRENNEESPVVNAQKEEIEQLNGDDMSIVVEANTIKVNGFDDASDDDVPYKSGGEVKWKHKPKGDEKSIHCEEKNTGDEFGLYGFSGSSDKKVPVKIGSSISWKFPMKVGVHECHSMNFDHESDSNITFVMSESNGEVTVKVGVYYV